MNGQAPRADPPRSASRAARRPWRRWRDELSIIAVLSLFAATVALGGWAWRLDRLFYDLALTLWSRPPPPGIVIVAIDEASIAEIGRWPWRRAVHATLLEQLALMHPRAVALDLLLTEPDPDPEQDRLLALAMAHAAPVVLPVALQGYGRETLMALEPAGPIRAQAHLGAADSPVDTDGVLRSAFLASGPEGALYPHLALALMQAAGEAVHPRVHAEPGANEVAPSAQQREGRLWIRYAGPPGTVERVSYIDVLSGKVPAARLAGRYVLIGATANGLGDTLATPVNRSHHAMPGIEVHANTLYTLRSGDTIAALAAPEVAWLAAALLALLVLLFGVFGPRVALPLAVASVPLALLASLLALGAGWWVDPVPYALAAVLAYPLWSWRRLERALTGLDLEIARLASEPLVGGPGSARLAGLTVGGGDAIAARLRTLRSAGAVVRQARRFLADSLAAMPTAMLVADEQAHVVLANPNAAALFEVDDAAEMHGLDLVRLLSEFRTLEPFDWPAAIAALRPSDKGIAVEALLGDDADYVVHVAAVDLQGARRLIVTVADVEPVKRAQREREEVLAFVSHDLRSPASSIVLLADMNLQGRVQTPQPELLQEMRRLAARTLAMSEGFVRAAQVQTQPLERAPVALRSLVDEALSDLQAQAQAADVALHTELSEPAALVNVDRLLLVRAIGNLVSNALKHSPRGARVEVLGAAPAGRLHLVVRDHGKGLAGDQLAQLARGDEGAAVRDARGVGLGLLFVQRVARRHGGTLSAAAAHEGSGARFELELPA